MNEPGDDVKNEPKRRLWWFLGFALMFLVGMLLLLLPSLGRPKELAKRAICGANLKDIGTGIALYQYDHNDLPPPNLAALVADGQPMDLLICPSTDTERATTTRPADITAHCDYIYAPLPADTKGGLVMAFELPVNHRQNIVNVLFRDYHVEGIQDMDRFVSLLQELNDYHAGLRRAKP